jgi:hypothetical protein
MLAIASGKFFSKVLFNFKNLYGNFWLRPDGFREYYLKLDGYYYNEKRKFHIAIIRIRNKRTFEEIPIKDIINDKDYLKELHPVDTFAIGLIANNERNGIISKNNVGWRKMCRAKNYECAVKSEPILYITKKYTNKENVEIIVLRSNILNKEIEIPTVELFKNHALLYSIGNYQAIEIGFDASEFFLKKSQRDNNT